jgi:hypothetical protein
MSVRPIRRINRKRLFVCAIAAVVLGIPQGFDVNAQAVAPPPRLPTTWTITILTNPHFSKPDGYTVERNNSSTVGCASENYATDASTLFVCQGDTVLWVANTPPDDNGNMTNEVFITPEGGFLWDGNNKPIPVAYGTVGTPAGGKIGPPAGPTLYKYQVTVRDSVHGWVSYDDPKIKIGTGTVADLIGDIETACGELVQLVKTDEAKTKIKNVCVKTAKELNDFVRPK